MIREERIREELIPEELIPEELIPQELFNTRGADSRGAHLICEELIPEELIPEDRIPEERIFRWDGRDGGAAAAKRVPVVDRRACPSWMEGRVHFESTLDGIVFSVPFSGPRIREMDQRSAATAYTPALSRSRSFLLSGDAAGSGRS